MTNRSLAGTTPELQRLYDRYGGEEPLRRIRDFPHDGSSSAQAMAAIARDALAATPALEPGAFLNDGTKIIPRSNLHPFYDQPPEAATPAVGGERIKEATAAQHFDLPKGEPARFVRNGILETCQCSDCAARKETA